MRIASLCPKVPALSALDCASRTHRSSPPCIMSCTSRSKGRSARAALRRMLDTAESLAGWWDPPPMLPSSPLSWRLQKLRVVRRVCVCVFVHVCMCVCDLVLHQVVGVGLGVGVGVVAATDTL